MTSTLHCCDRNSLMLCWQKPHIVHRGVYTAVDSTNSPRIEACLRIALRGPCPLQRWDQRLWRQIWCCQRRRARTTFHQGMHVLRECAGVMRARQYHVADQVRLSCCVCYLRRERLRSPGKFLHPSDFSFRSLLSSTSSGILFVRRSKASLAPFCIVILFAVS